MRLSTLLEGTEIKKMAGGADIADIGELSITGLAIDSRRVRAGDLFFALRGGRADGNAFITEALGRGAAAVLTDSHGTDRGAATGPVFMEVADGRLALARIAANFYGNPSGRMSVVGVTGTNGKTTTALLIREALERLGRKTGLIGTIKYIVGGRETPAAFTTPEAHDFQRMLREMLEAGQTHAVSEVSSHALIQRRVDFTTFSTAVFTNLTRDHLDFHKTMEDYFAAKKLLFTGLLKRGSLSPAVINTDDPFGLRLARELLHSGKTRVLGFGMEGDPDIRAVSVRNTASGVRFGLVFKEERFTVNSPLVGAHNVYNLLSAFGALIGLGFGASLAVAAIESLGSVKGRFERIECGQDFLVVVDYAHTPDALQRLITAGRAIAGNGRVIVVFGCGGDRDRGKRPQMGRIAGEMADFVIVTSDNPRSEEPSSIISEITNGMGGMKVKIIPDRAEAIKTAIQEVKSPSDVVLIAGKGHEGYQEINGVRNPFSDQAAAAEALRMIASDGRRNARSS